MTSTGQACEAFVSVPIKLAARISERGRRGQLVTSENKMSSKWARRRDAPQSSAARARRQLVRCASSRGGATKLGLLLLATCCLLNNALSLAQAHLQQRPSNSQLVNHDAKSPGARDQSSMLRHHAHYLNFVPSAHFSYNEGRQVGARSLELDSVAPVAAVAPASEGQVSGSHIYKRSSAVLMEAGAKSAPSSQQASGTSAQNPLSRRMMSNSNVQLAKLSVETPPTVKRQSNWLGVGAPMLDLQAEGSQARERFADINQDQAGADQLDQQQQQQQLEQPVKAVGKRQSEQEAELLRQKQHIQYHDQWPSMAGKCHKRTLNFCASVLPFNTTTFPNIIGDTTRFEVKRSLPFFGFLAKSSCNKRLDELLCLLLEPPCSAHQGTAIPPCKKFCRLALEGCNEYIPATLALSSVFDCRQYPDSTDPSVCVNLAQGDKCAPDEFKCPDKTCIPRNWLCDGVRDCIFAADEANCTDSAAVPHASVCSTEEFKCDGKCVPKAWKCDGERDCRDGSDEENCDLRPRCGPDRFKCADGNGCIPKRWVCDGKAECRDGSDEMNCNQRECSENDFKCDNGICIPKLWRCDRQFDCKDGSDERQCVYPTPSTTTTSTTTTTTTTTTTSPETVATVTQSNAAAATTIEALQLNASSSYGLDLSQVTAGEIEAGEQVTDQSSSSNGPSKLEDSSQAKQQLELSLMSDISRFIQHDRESTQQRLVTSTSATGPSSSADGSDHSQTSPQTDDQQQTVVITTTTQQQQQQQSEPAQSSPRPPVDGAGGQQQVASGQLAGELKRLNYDLIPSATNMVQVSNEPAPPSNAGDPHRPAPGNQQPNSVVTQIDFMPQQQQTQRPIFPHQRVPIYRSLFKSLKGNHHHNQVGGPNAQFYQPNGMARNVVAVARRRRDRHNHHHHHQQPSSAGQLGDGSGQQQQALMQMQMQRQQLNQMQLNNNQTFARPAGGSGAQELSGPVASYLQLLNGRYNLRLPRVGGANLAQTPLAH